MSTFFVLLFAVASLATFAAGARREWKNLRLGSAIVAILSFLMALLTVTIKSH